MSFPDFMFREENTVFPAFPKKMKSDIYYSGNISGL